MQTSIGFYFYWTQWIIGYEFFDSSAPLADLFEHRFSFLCLTIAIRRSNFLL